MESGCSPLSTETRRATESCVGAVGRQGCGRCCSCSTTLRTDRIDTALSLRDLWEGHQKLFPWQKVPHCLLLMPHSSVLCCAGIFHFLLDCWWKYTESTLDWLDLLLLSRVEVRVPLVLLQPECVLCSVHPLAPPWDVLLLAAISSSFLKYPRASKSWLVTGYQSFFPSDQWVAGSQSTFSV